MFKRKQKTPKAQPQVSKSAQKPKERFLKRLVSYFKTHKKTRLFVFGLISLGVSLGLLFALYKVILVLLGTIMQFWFRYTSNEILLWVRRSEYLKREEQEETDPIEVEVDEDWFQSDSGWQ